MKNFIIVTEVGRLRGKITGSIYQIIKNRPKFITGFEYYPQSNRGMEHEAANALVIAKCLPKTALNASGYIAMLKTSPKYSFFVVEGRGLNYISQNFINQQY